MAEGVTLRAVANKGQKQAPDRLRSLLVALDLTPISDRILARVALLPLSEGAQLTLLHVVPKSLPAGERRSAERTATKLLADEASALAKRLPKGVSITPLVKVGSPAHEIAAGARRAKVELVVMGRGDATALRDLFLGSTAERVIRRIPVPALVVRLPARRAYRRPAVAIDFDYAAHDALATLLRAVPTPRPRVLVIHAYEMLYKGRVYQELSRQVAEEYRAHFQQQASRRLARLLAAFPAQARVSADQVPAWKTHVSCGPPRLVIKKAVRRNDTDLLVLGTRAFTGVKHLFLGTIAGDILREVACDVLVVPPRK